MKKIAVFLLIFSFQIFSHQIDKQVINKIHVVKFPELKKEMMEKSGNELQKFEGVYRFALGKDMKIYLKDSTLRALISGQPEYILVQIAENEFKLKGLEGYKMIFKLDEGEKVVSVTSSQPNGDFSAEKISNEVELPKQEKTVTLSEDQLRKYEGEYQFAPGNDMKVYVKDGKLKASLKGQPEYTLLPVSKKEFILENLTGFKMIFEENKNGEITAVVSSQPNGDFKAERKNK